MTPSPLALPEELQHLAQALGDAGGRAYLVGGAVRDALLGIPLPKDLDVEVFGLRAPELEAVLQRFGKVQLVGKSFGVWKLATEHADYDFSLPRRERKIAAGHQGFEVESDGKMSFAEASSRRDFTLNSMGYEILTACWEDPHGGLNDLRQRVLRHVGPAFSEDPLRALRAVQFVGRFQLSLHPETVRLCRQQDLSEVSPERLFEEFRKLLLQAPMPSLGMRALEEMEGLRFFPELDALTRTPQQPEWHPEGNVWLHTLMVLDEAARLRVPEEPDALALMLGALCHDLGKPSTTVWADGRWRSPRHDVVGVEVTQRFLGRLTRHQALLETVCALVQNHLQPYHLYSIRKRLTSGAIRRLALRVPIPLLVRLAQADFSGRTLPESLRRDFPAGDWLLKEAQRLEVAHRKPQPLLQGRHLIALGVKPGPQMGQLLQEAFEQQLEGAFQTLPEAQAWIRDRLESACS